MNLQASEDERNLEGKHSLLLPDHKQDGTLKPLREHVHGHTHPLRLMGHRGEEKAHTPSFIWLDSLFSGLSTHLVPGDGVIESIDGLVVAGDRVTVEDFKLGVFLDHSFGDPHCPGAPPKLGHK